MAVEKVNPPGLHRPVDNLYAHVVRAQGPVHYRIGGQVAVDADGRNIHVGDMAAQLRSCYEQVTLALESVGLSWQDVVHIYTFTTAMDDYLKAEPPIAKSFFGETPPASTLVEVSRLVERDWLVEVQVDAVADR
jgi:enamine deaminase RidA (YjgF/YER057c/UK114 family)